MHEITTVIDKNIWVELLSAFWRGCVNDKKDPPGPRPLFTPVQAKAFVEAALDGETIAILREVFAATGKVVPAVLASGAPIRFAPGTPQAEAAARLAGLFADADLTAKISAAFAETGGAATIDAGRLLEVSEKSRFSAPSLFAALLSDVKRITIVPSAFMVPAPGGKVGCVREIEGGREVVLVFGFSEGYGRPGYLEWAQWYRLGVWHVLLYHDLLGRWQRLGMPKAEQEAIFSRIPAAYLKKVSIHDFAVGDHKDLASFVIDNVLAAYKIAGEREMSGRDASDQQAKWLTSLGRFTVPWFLEQIGETPTDRLDLDRLVAALGADIGRLTAADPVFAGPLGACENPIWNTDLRLVFGPSVGPVTRRVVTMWFNQYWPMKPTIIGLSVSGDADWDRHCNLVFAVAADLDRLAPLVDTVRLEATGASVRELVDEGGSIVLALKNPTSPGHWSRICLAPSEDELVSIHHAVRYFTDWTLKTAEGTVSGRAEVLDDDTTVLVAQYPA